MTTHEARITDELANADTARDLADRHSREGFHEWALIFGVEADAHERAAYALLGNVS